MAGYKMISMVLLVVLIALAVGSPAFATDDEAFITLTPTAACPGETVTISNIPIRDDIVGGGIRVAAMSPLSFPIVLSSDPVGLTASKPQNCLVQDTSVKCTFLVSESAKCGHYTVTVTILDNALGLGVSRPFDVAGPCCPAVGGCVQPVNTFALVSPYLAVIAVVGCIGTAVVVAKKRGK